MKTPKVTLKINDGLFAIFNMGNLRLDESCRVIILLVGARLLQSRSISAISRYTQSMHFIALKIVFIYMHYYSHCLDRYC